MPSIAMYAHALANAFGSTSAGNSPNIDFLSDTMNLALVTSGYTPDLAAHDFWNDVVANEASGTGYTANGATLASKTLTVTAANSWATQWAASTARQAGDVVRPTTGNGFLYAANGAGTNSASEPTWPTTVGATVTDGGVTWSCIGRAIVVFDAADVSWASSTVAARYGVIYDRTPGSDATRPLFALIDFDSTVSSTNATFSVQFPAQGICYIAIG
jgi:hypothetical protein